MASVGVQDFPGQFPRTRRFSLGAPRRFTVSPGGRRVLFLRTGGGTLALNSPAPDGHRAAGVSHLPAREAVTGNLLCAQCGFLLRALRTDQLKGERPGGADRTTP